MKRFRIPDSKQWAIVFWLLSSEKLLSLHRQTGLVAQWIEQQPSKLRVEGSNPSGITLQEFLVFSS
jgi:hypothetical protein